MHLAGRTAQRLAGALEARGRALVATAGSEAEAEFRADVEKVAAILERRVGPSARLDADLVRWMDDAQAGLTPGSPCEAPDEAVLEATALALASKRRLRLGDQVEVTDQLVGDALELMPLIWWQRVGRRAHAHCVLDSDARWSSLTGLLRRLRAGDVGGAYEALPAAAAAMRSKAEDPFTEIARPGPALLDFLRELDEVQRVALMLSGKVVAGRRYAVWTRLQRQVVGALRAAEQATGGEIA